MLAPSNQIDSLTSGSRFGGSRVRQTAPDPFHENVDLAFRQLSSRRHLQAVGIVTNRFHQQALLRLSRHSRRSTVAAGPPSPCSFPPRDTRSTARPESAARVSRRTPGPPEKTPAPQQWQRPPRQQALRKRAAGKRAYEAWVGKNGETQWWDRAPPLSPRSSPILVTIDPTLSRAPA
jgi:hypothetical protein